MAVTAIALVFSSVLTFKEAKIPGAFVVETDPSVDDRGEFTRRYCRDEFAAQGIDFVPLQISTSSNRSRGTIRGLHFQAAPRPEGKLVSCLRGSIFDVAVDLRSDSSTFGSWVSVELRGDEPRSFYIPPGCAHGFQTLEDATELLYLISEPYAAYLQRGLRWDDPTLAISWPEREATILSSRDATFPTFAELMQA